MGKLFYKILALILLISFTTEIVTPLFPDSSSISLLIESQDLDEKKENEKKEKEEEIKDRNSSNSNFLPLIEMVTDFYLKNELVNTLGFLSLPDMPPDQA
jgi:hypothetical protein